MKMLCALFLLLSCGIVSAASLSFNWSTEISDARPYSAQAFQGETFALKATMLQYAAPLAITATATFYYQTPEMPSTQWYTSDAHYDSATATVSTTFTPAMDVGAPSYRFFFGIDDATGKNYRVYGTIRLRPSPGFTPSTIVPSDVKQELIDAITADVQAYVRSRYTPLTAHQELANLLSIHRTDKNNPHSVTAAQLGALTSETDPTISAWAKAQNKPTYTASEVGAPTVQQLNALSASLNSHAAAKNNPHGVTAAQLGALTSESDPTISAWAKAPAKPAYTASEVGAPTIQQLDAVSASLNSHSTAKNNPHGVTAVQLGALTAESDPTISAWAKAKAKPTYTASEVGALSAESDPTISAWAKAANKPAYTAAEVGALSAESDPTISAWAKAPNKPAYTVAEVGAAAASHTHKVANISDFPTSWAWGSVSGIPSWIGSTKPTYTASEVGAPTVQQLDAVSASLNSHSTAKNNPHGVTAVQIGALTAETDPTVSAWAKAKAKPTYTASEVGALSSESDPTVSAWAKAQNKPAYTASEVGAAAFSSTSMVTNGVTYVWTWSDREGTFVLHHQ